MTFSKTTLKSRLDIARDVSSGGLLIAQIGCALVPGLGEIEMVARGFEMFNNATAFRQLGTSIGDFARGKYGKGASNLIGAMMQAGTGIKTHNTNITRRAMNGALESAENLEKASATAEITSKSLSTQMESVKNEWKTADESFFNQQSKLEAENRGNTNAIGISKVRLGVLEKAMENTSTSDERINLMNSLDQSDEMQKDMHDWLTSYHEDRNALQTKLDALPNRPLSKTDRFYRGITNPEEARRLARVRYIDEFHQTDSYQYYSKQLPQYQNVVEDDMNRFGSDIARNKSEIESIQKQRAELSAPYLTKINTLSAEIRSAQRTTREFEQSVQKLLQIQKNYSTLYYKLRIAQLASDVTSNVNNYV